VPAQFSWIDQRLVREGYLERCPVPALALYLLLVTVADAQGLSYYGDATVCRLLSLSSAQLEGARAALLGAGLIAYERPLYQVLALDPPGAPRTVGLRSTQTVLARLSTDLQHRSART
jgi:hypothetical protein